MRQFVPKEAFEAHQSEEDFLVWPENWSAIIVFARCGRQWHTDFGQRVGLNLSGVRIVAETLEIPWDVDLLDALQVMEAVQIEELARRRDLQPQTL